MSATKRKREIVIPPEGIKEYMRTLGIGKGKDGENDLCVLWHMPHRTVQDYWRGESPAPGVVKAAFEYMVENRELKAMLERARKKQGEQEKHIAELSEQVATLSQQLVEHENIVSDSGEQGGVS